MSPTHSRVDGLGAPIVLVHGVGLNHTMWDPIVEPLATTRKVVRYDLLGHNKSSDPTSHLDSHDFVEQLSEVFDSHGIQAGDVVGFSLGAFVALAFAARYPSRVRRLVLVSIVFDRNEAQRAEVVSRLNLAQTSGMQPVAKLAIDRWFSLEWQRSNPEVVEKTRRTLASNNQANYLKAYRILAESDAFAKKLAPTVEASTLVIAGECDPGSTPEMAFELADVLPSGKVFVVPGARHLIPIETPKLFLETLVEFIERDIP